MDRRTLSTILLAIAVFALVYMGAKGCSKDKGWNYFAVRESHEVVKLPAGVGVGQPCTIDRPEFTAQVAPVAGGLLSFQLKGQKYVEAGKPIDVAERTARDVNGGPVPNFAPLRTYFRNGPGEDQVPGDLVEFTVRKEGDACILEHTTPEVVEIRRVVRPSARPYELETETTIKNLAHAPRKHAYSTTLYALQFKSQEGGMFSRPSANAIFQAACAHDGGKLERKDKGSLKDWFQQSGNLDWVAISSGYIAEAVIPLDQGAKCALIAQDRGTDPEHVEQSLFQAFLTYPQKELAEGQSATYKQLAFIGPKERPLLAAAAGGGKHLDQLIDLGWFSVIAKVLVRYLALLQGLVHSWGVAIILLTVTVRLALMPLTLPQVRSSLAMRRLKPELDALNKKFESDQQAKMLATSQLYKKHGVNPLAGCLPALLQMPVWFALYTALQTAIELFHEPFLFWSDLSSPDPRFILPGVLGVTMFIQQKVTPMQMDPAQQKIFTYFMPALFTVFMLFLPAGLGVYMLTNSILGIAQTIAVERYYAATHPPEVQVKEVPSTPKGGGSGGGKDKAKSGKELARTTKKTDGKDAGSANERDS